MQEAARRGYGPVGARGSSSRTRSRRPARPHGASQGRPRPGQDPAPDHGGQPSMQPPQCLCQAAPPCLPGLPLLLRRRAGRQASSQGQRCNGTLT
jgi:hypothetical protein